ncbi:hypothetical protein GCM10027299_29160 [Larkinella ripae]
MKKILLALSLVWAATACQQPDATIAPLKKPAADEPATSSRPIKLDLPDGVQLNPTPSATHGVLLLYTNAIGRPSYSAAMPHKGEIVKRVKLSLLDPLTNRLVSGFAGPLTESWPSNTAPTPGNSPSEKLIYSQVPAGHYRLGAWYYNVDGVIIDYKEFNLSIPARKYTIYAFY